MIPPVSVRQVRPCKDCVVYESNYGFSQCSVQESSTSYRQLKKYRCRYHLCPSEYRELIDLFICDGRRPQQEIEDKLKELYEAQTSLSKETGDIAWDASCLVSAKVRMLEWVLQLDWFTIEQKAREHSQQEADA